MLSVKLLLFVHLFGFALLLHQHEDIIPLGEDFYEIFDSKPGDWLITLLVNLVLIRSLFE